MAEFKSSVNGKKVVINAAPFEDAIRLRNAVFAKIDLKKFDLQNIDIGTVLDTIVKMDTSIKVQRALMKCLLRSSYDGEKITKETFNKDGVREEYYEIIKECIQVNIGPFVKGLISQFGGIKEMITKNTPKLS